METLACMSARTCPACWRYAGGKCTLMAELRGVLGPASRPASAAPLLGLAPA